MTNKIISNLVATVAAAKAVVLFNNPAEATYTAYNVGDALGYIYEGWRIEEIKAEWIKLVCDGQPDRVVTMDGRVRVRHENGWRLSRKEVSMCAIGIGSTTLIVGDTYPVKEVFKFWGAKFIKDVPLKEFGGQPVSAWLFHGALPMDVKDLLHAARPGVWQCVVALLQGSPLWLAGDHHNIVGIVSGFCTRTGNREFGEAMGTNKAAAMRKLEAYPELWAAFVPGEAEEPQPVVEVESAVASWNDHQPVMEVVVNTPDEKPAKAPRGKGKGKPAPKHPAVTALECVIRGDLPENAAALVVSLAEEMGTPSTNAQLMAMLLKMQALMSVAPHDAL